MGGFGSVSPGDKLKLTARWINAINHLLNEQGDVGAGASVAAPGANKVQVYNAGSSALVAGAAVEFVTSGAVIGGMIPCSALSNVGARWGVLTNYLEPQQGGGCVVAGPVKVSSIIGSGAESVLPVVGNGAVVSGAQVWSCAVGGVPLLGGGASGGIVLLGGGGSVRLGAVVTMPTGGAGAGAVQIATPTVSGGVILTSGASIPVVMPYLDGAN